MPNGKIGTKKQRRAMKKAINQLYGTPKQRSSTNKVYKEAGMVDMGNGVKKGYAKNKPNPGYKNVSPVGKIAKKRNRNK